MSELFEQFGIDWRLLFAQAVNFAVLFFILYRFAYRPILGMLETRKKKIEEGLTLREAAERKLAAAEREGKAIVTQAEKESLRMVERAETIGQERGEAALAEAGARSQEIIREGKSRAAEEKKLALETFTREAEELVRQAVAKVVVESPEAIDRKLVTKALTELERVRV